MDRFSPDTRTALRRDLMKRGSVLATRLSDVLAGKEHPEITAMLLAKPGMRPEEVVRAALEQVEARRALLDANDDRYGRCDVCGAEIPEAALRDVPWADRCPAHASQ